jgi:hypothetical protein
LAESNTDGLDDDVDDCLDDGEVDDDGIDDGVDLGIFYVQKAEASKVRPNPGPNPQMKQIIKAVNGYHKAYCRTCVIGPFQKAGIVLEYDPTHNALVARVDRTQASNIRH